MVPLRLDAQGRCVVGPEVWHREIQSAQNAGLLSGSFKIVGQTDEAKAQTLGFAPKKDEQVKVENHKGIIVANQAQVNQMLYDAKRERRVLRSQERPKNWS